jgi:hypothetical protein
LAFDTINLGWISYARYLKLWPNISGINTGSLFRSLRPWSRERSLRALVLSQTAIETIHHHHVATISAAT